MTDGESLGSTIRSLRRELNLTQEQLAEGICSAVSISRIENGRQRPSKAVLDALMERLGMTSYQLFDVNAGSEEQREFDGLAQAAWTAFDRLDISAGQNLLDRLRADTSEDSPTAEHQRLLELEAGALLRSKGSRAEAGRALDLLREALELTKPGIDLADFRRELLSPREAEILSFMVVGMHGVGRDIDSIRLGEEVLSALDRQKAQGQPYLPTRLAVMVNLAAVEEDMGLLKESVLLLQRARQESLDEGELNLMPFILAGLARASWQQTGDEEAVATLGTVANYLDLCERHDYAQDIRSWARDHMGVRL